MEGLNRLNAGDCGANNMALTKMDSQMSHTHRRPGDF